MNTYNAGQQAVCVALTEIPLVMCGSPCVPIAATFSPNDLPGLVAWYKSSTGVTVTPLPGATTPLQPGVSRWEDQSQAIGGVDPNKHSTQATPALQPGYAVGGANGFAQAAVVPMGSEFLRTGTFLKQVTQPCTVFAVAVVTNGASNQYLFDGSTANRLAVFEGSGTQINLFAGSALLEAIPSINVPIAVWGIVNGASSQVAVNASQPAVTGAGGANHADGFTLGNTQGGGAFSTMGPLMEIIIYSGVLAPGQIARVMRHLAGQYGIALFN